MKKYMVIDYFDVWASEDGGWTVNDARTVTDNLVLPDNASDKEILNALVKIGFLTTSDMRRYVVEELGDFIEVYQRKQMIPICSLREVV